MIFVGERGDIRYPVELQWTTYPHRHPPAITDDSVAIIDDSVAIIEDSFFRFLFANIFAPDALTP